MATKDFFKNKKIQVIQSNKLLELRLEGFDGLVGVIDETEKVFYMPDLDNMSNRLKLLLPSQFGQVMKLYLEAGKVLKKKGYQRRHIADY